MELLIKGLSGRENRGGSRLLNIKRYVKLLISAYLIKKIKTVGYQKGKGLMFKYAKLVLGTFILNKFKSDKSQKKAEDKSEEIEASDADEGSSITAFGTMVLGVLAGATILYAFRKYAADKREYQIEVE
jgi:hypothetical protein